MSEKLLKLYYIHSIISISQIKIVIIIKFFITSIYICNTLIH